MQSRITTCTYCQVTNTEARRPASDCLYQQVKTKIVVTDVCCWQKGHCCRGAGAQQLKHLVLLQWCIWTLPQKSQSCVLGTYWYLQAVAVVVVYKKLLLLLFFICILCCVIASKLGNIIQLVTVGDLGEIHESYRATTDSIRFTEAALPLSCSKINPHTSQINLASLGTPVHKAPRPSKAWVELINLHTSQATWCILFIYVDVSNSVYVKRCDATLTKVWRFIVLQCWKASLGVRLPCNCLLLWWADNNTVCALIILPSMGLC